jgi:hypothetical protein
MLAVSISAERKCLFLVLVSCARIAVTLTVVAKCRSRNARLRCLSEG